MERMGTEYQIFNGKEYVSLKRFWNIEGKYKTEKAKNGELEEENKKLKDDLRIAQGLVEKYEEIEIKMGKENKNLKLIQETNENQLKNDIKERDELREENKKLNEKVRFLEECLDRKEKLNKEYRKNIDKYKRQYEHSMGFMEEDTLQELRDIGEL